MKRNMLKVTIWVSCTGWASGGYENIMYFKDLDEFNEWASGFPFVTAKKVEKVSFKEFAEDYICDL